MTQNSERAELNCQLKMAGMLSIDEMLHAVEVPGWHQHTGVTDLASFKAWLDMKHTEALSLRARIELAEGEAHELYEWALAHCGVLHAVRANLSRAVVRHDQRAIRVFIDMDGVIVDFEGYMTETGLPADEIKHTPGSYFEMKPIDGALDAVRQVIAMGFEVWIATKPPTASDQAYRDKVRWILKYLPELKQRIIITHDKGLLGSECDFLCDDRPHKANCERFSGTLLRFVDGYHWPEALQTLGRVSLGQASA